MENKEYIFDVEALLKAGMTMAGVSQDKDLLFAIVPSGGDLVKIDIAERNEQMQLRREELALGRPVRNTGIIKVADVDSFIAMVQREAITATTVVMANLRQHRFVAIINFAENGEKAGFGDRSIELELQKTTEFLRWLNNDRERMSQLQLADFLEENLESIIDPPAGEVVEMISNLKVKRKAKYHSVIDTRTGQQSLSFSEEIKGEVQNGTMDFNSKFKVALTPFYGSKPYEIVCNLRFSVDEERLSIFFSMINIAKIVDHAFDVENQKIREHVAALQLPVVNVR